MVPALQDCLASLDRGQSGLVVTHGAAMKVAVTGMLGWPVALAASLEGGRQLRLGHARGDRARGTAAAGRLQREAAARTRRVRDTGAMDEIIPEVTRYVRPDGGVVVGDDGSEGAAHAVRYALEEARRRGCTLHVLRAWSILSSSRPADVPPGFAASMPEYEAACTDEESARIEHLLGTAHGIPVDVHCVHSTPAAALIEASAVRGGGRRRLPRARWLPLAGARIGGRAVHPALLRTGRRRAPPAAGGVSLPPISHPGEALAKILRVASDRTGPSGGAVAQLVAHLHGMEGVRGSSPLSSTEHAGQGHAGVLERGARHGPGTFVGHSSALSTRRTYVWSRLGGPRAGWSAGLRLAEPMWLACRRRRVPACARSSMRSRRSSCAVHISSATGPEASPMQTSRHSSHGAVGEGGAPPPRGGAPVGARPRLSSSSGRCPGCRWRRSVRWGPPPSGRAV